MRLTLSPLRKLLPRKRHRSLGQSLVEFALILPVFLLLFGAVLDLGRIAAARITVENAAREGAFEASDNDATYDAAHGWLTTDPWDPATDPCDPDTDSVTCRVLLESRSESFVSIAPDDVQMTCDPSCTSGMGHTSTVTVAGQFTLLTPILYAFVGGNADIMFEGRSTTQIETLPPPPAVAVASPSPSSSPSSSPSASPSPSPTASCGTPSAGFTHTALPSSMVAPVTITVADTSTFGSLASCTITSWTWNFGDGTILTGQTQSPHTYVKQGTYQVTLTVMSPGGSSTTGKVTIMVKNS